ncbi:DMT family transporter [Nocardia transvalensis]|uniref:DMT family transporter n=1 Tax=Nocardia transvalensis TaxID=37333 RepID=UPI0018938181|nr:DMT family transporter [Nocardia transvalensis]MBF6328363.1 DMT family transporter [Nocardia transvalensis]
MFTRYLDHGFTIAQQVYLRTAVAFVLAVILFGRRIRWRVVAHAGAREWGVIVVRTVLLYVIGTVLFAKAATMTSVANVSFIAALPLASALGLLLCRVRATVARVGFVTGSALGVAILSGFRPGPGGSWLDWNEGDLLALVAMVAMAWSYLGREWHCGTLNNQEISALTLGVGTVGTVLISLAQGQGLPQLATPIAPVLLWGAVAVAGALSVANVFLINYGFERVDPVLAGNLLTVECVWGLLFGLAFFQQVPTVNGIVGGALIVACAIGLNAAEKRTPAEKRTRPAERRRRDEHAGAEKITAATEPRSTAAARRQRLTPIEGSSVSIPHESRDKDDRAIA